MKSQVCTDDRKQQDEMNREDMASPTDMARSVLITSGIDAEKEREVAVVDLPGAFLHVDMGDLANVLLRGELAEFMAAVAPDIYR